MRAPSSTDKIHRPGQCGGTLRCNIPARRKRGRSSRGHGDLAGPVADTGAYPTEMTIVTHTTTQPRRQTRAATSRRIVTLTGVQPTGDLHLGNYAGAIRPLTEIAADPARDVYVFVGLRRDRSR
jgi:hypothetical protein